MLTFFAVFATLPYYISPALAAGGALGFLLVPDPVGVVQCEQYTIQWQGGVAPFSVQVRDPVEAGNIYFFNAIVSTNSIVWVVDKLGVAPGSFPLPFLVAVTDSAGSISTSAAETVAPATIPLDSSGLCTSISTARNTGTSDPGTSSSSSSSSAPTTDSDTTTSTTPTTSPKASVTKSGSSSSSSIGSGSGSSSASTAAASGAAAPHKKISSGAIAGAVVGGVILISLLGAIFGVLRQRHHKALMDDLTANDYHLELHGKKTPPRSRRNHFRPSTNLSREDPLQDPLRLLTRIPYPDITMMLPRPCTHSPLDTSPNRTLGSMKYPTLTPP
ncbi:hypothetical protein B0H13DRAFT_2332481 [Mycena leptocephala]|nr:hypothetical protein B0H13DRAFT_2332481 [Mycena leptocephala]